MGFRGVWDGLGFLESVWMGVLESMVCGESGGVYGCQGSGGVQTSPFFKRFGQLVIHQNPKLPDTVDLTCHNNILQYISG